MKIETTPRDDHQVKMTVEIDNEQFEKSMHQAARKIANRIKIPGFRPGKAPYEMVVRQVGEDGIKEEAIELLINDIYPQALDEAKLKPGAMGKLENLSDKTPPTFEFLVPLSPEVKLGDYRSIRKDYTPPTIDDKAVDEFIQKLRMNYATSEPVDREARRGDIVYLNLSGNLVEPDEGQNPSLLKEGNYPVLIPESGETSNEWPYPGFGEQLIGKEVGFEGASTYQYADDSDLEHLRGKKIEYKFKIDSVKALVLPELDDSFLAMLGEKGTLEDFRKNVKDQLQSKESVEYDRNFSNEIVEEIRKSSVIKYPPQILEDEIEEMLKSLEHDLSHQKMDLTTYLKTRNLEKEAFVESEVKPAAIDRLERSLVMDEFTQAEEIKLDMTQWDDAVNETARNLSYTTDMEALRKRLSKDQLTQAVTYETANRLMNKQIFDRMKAIAAGESIPTKEEVNKSSGKSTKSSVKKSSSTKKAVEENSSE